MPRCRVIRRILSAITRWLSTPRVIFDREGGTPYLSRWYLIGNRPDIDDKLAGQAKDDASPRRFSLFLHRFHRSDDDGALHNHPWAWSVSLILAGGYWEERRVGDRVVRRLVKPWRINWIGGDTFHRVDLLEGDAWSLFLVGPKVSTWYFWDRYRLQRSQWRDFINAKRGVADDAAWVPDSRGDA
jgi:hypothetical protein